MVSIIMLSVVILNAGMLKEPYYCLYVFQFILVIINAVVLLSNTFDQVSKLQNFFVLNLIIFAIS
jgi:hypothetical protein